MGLKINNENFIELPSGYTQLEYVESTLIASKVLNGTETWHKEGTSPIFMWTSGIIPSGLNSSTAGGCCTHYLYAGIVGGTGVETGHFFYNSPGTGSTNGNLSFVDDDYGTDTTTWQAYLTAQYAAGTPVTLCYALATAVSTANKIYKMIGGLPNKRTYIPAKNSSNVAGLYCLEDETFISSIGTGTFTAGPEVNAYKDLKELYKKTDASHGLPSAYTELEYLESTGTQYIDTGFAPNQDTRVLIEMKALSDADDVFYAFGSRGSSYLDRAYECYAWGKKFQLNYAGQSIFPLQITVGEKIVLDFDKNNCKFYHETMSEGSLIGEYSFIKKTFLSPQSLALFGLHESSSVSKGQAVIYSCKIYDNGTLVRDFVPCINKLTSEAGMYDTVNDVFYTNSGTGTFTAGDEIPSTEYIGELYKNNNGSYQHVFSAGYDTTLTTNPATTGVARAKSISYSISGDSKQESDLPSGYTQLAYIQATGTGTTASSLYYIDTGIAGSLDTEIETNITHVFSSGTNLLTPISSARSSTNGIAISHYSTGPDWATRFGNIGWADKGTITSGTEYHIIFNKDTFTVNGTSSSIGATTQTNTDNIYLMCDVWAGAIPTTVSLRMGETIIRKNNSVVFDGIPAKDSSDNVGLYDLVSGTFKTNGGTGTFTAGPECPTPSSPLDITSVGNYDSTTSKYLIPIKVNSTTTNISLDSPLSGISTYKDIVDSTGTLTRNIGIKVLDGTESWVLNSGVASLFQLPISGSKAQSTTPYVGLCSHYLVNETTVAGGISDNEITFQNLSATGNGRISIKDTTNGQNNLETWKAYVAAQYAAGTPVIVYYPLSTATTETVTVPSISTTGNVANTFEVETEMEPGAVSWTYRKKYNT